MGTESDYRKWFSNAGFVLESFEDVSAQVRKTWTICVRRLLLHFSASLAISVSYSIAERIIVFSRSLFPASGSPTPSGSCVTASSLRARNRVAADE